MLKTLQILVLVSSVAILMVAAYWMKHGYFWEVMSALLALIVYDVIKHPELHR